jgi:hypothetical protein
LSKWTQLRDGLRLIALIFRNTKIKGVPIGEIADEAEKDAKVVVGSVRKFKARPKPPTR